MLLRSPIPAETPISVRLVTPVASNTSKVEDQVRGTLAKPIIVSGTTVVPAGSEVIGSIIEATESGRVKGRALDAFRFDRLNVGADSHRIRTARIASEAESSTKCDVRKAPQVRKRAVVGGICRRIGRGNCAGAAGPVRYCDKGQGSRTGCQHAEHKLLEPVKVRLKVGS
jgi:hypothetical protein